jgi:glycosyltransferase involved in cell wall biosynthesis
MRTVSPTEPTPVAHYLVLVISDLEAGGAQRVFVDLANNRVRAGRKTDLICIAGHGLLRNALDPRVNLIDLKCSSMINAVPLLLRYLSQNAECAVVSAMPEINVAVLLASRILRFHRGPVVIQEVSRFGYDREEIAPWRTFALRHAARVLYPRADRIIAVAEDVADDISEKFKVDRSAISIIPNPIAFDQIVRKAGETCPHPWLEPKQLPVILAVGRLAPVKNYETLLRAFAQVRQSRPVRLIILGSGVCEPVLRQLAEQLGIVDDLDLAGFQSNPWTYMARANLLVVSSLSESFSMVLVEALSCGTNVVCVDCGAGPRSILSDARFGIMPCPQDAEGLAKAICYRLDNPLPREFLAGQARRYDIAHVAAQYERLVAAAVRGRLL